MSTIPQPVVGIGAYLTLHYQLATADGTEIVTTFHANPATLQIGTGQLAPFLEQKLIGLPEDARCEFALTPDEAFGQRNPELIQRVSRDTLAQNSQLGEDYSIGDVVEFNAPGGGRFAGVLREIDGDDTLFDFNHPLAGQALSFKVHIIGIL